MTARIGHTVTRGTFHLDGETFAVDNNVWVIGDEQECVVVDAPHSVEDILAVVGKRTVKAIVCTHAHDDHVRVAPALREAVTAPILLHPEDRPLWELTHGEEHLWDADWEGVTNVIEVHVNRLRSKIDRDFSVPLLQTVRGRGYVLRSS